MSLEYRLDGRSLKTYTKHILIRTRRENLWAEILKVNLEEKGYKVQVKDNGVDGSGAVVKKSSKDLSKVDKIYTINGKKIPIEIKTCDQGEDFDTLDFITIKVTSLRAAIEQNALMVICDRKWRMVLRPQCMERLLKDFTPKICRKFAGNALCIMVKKSQFKKYILEKEENFEDVKKIQLCRWTDKAKKIIASNQEKLFKKKHWL